MIWLQLVYLAHGSTTISKKFKIKNVLAPSFFKLCAEVKIDFTTAKEFTGREMALFRKLNEIWSSFTNNF